MWASAFRCGSCNNVKGLHLMCMTNSQRCDFTKRDGCVIIACSQFVQKEHWSTFDLRCWWPQGLNHSVLMNRLLVSPLTPDSIKEASDWKDTTSSEPLRVKIKPVLLQRGSEHSENWKAAVSCCFSFQIEIFSFGNKLQEFPHGISLSGLPLMPPTSSPLPSPKPQHEGQEKRQEGNGRTDDFFCYLFFFDER